MIRQTQTSEESIATAPADAEKEPKEGPRSRKLSTRTFDFLWKRDARRDNTAKKEENQWKREDLIEVKIVERKLKNEPPATKMSFDFFRNIKKQMQIKNFTMCKSKRKNKESETFGLQNAANQGTMVVLSGRPVIPVARTVSELKYYVSPTSSSEPCDKEAPNTTKARQQTENTTQTMPEMLENYSNIEQNGETICTEMCDNNETDNNREVIPVEYRCGSNTKQELLHDTAIARKLMESRTDNNKESTDILPDVTDAVANDNKVKASLAEELLKLSKYGWYWGPISGEEVDAKLISEPDGAFLVRDSSDDRYVLTLSFKSSGKLLHARMEHSGGLFSLCNQSESEGFTSVAALINHTMNFSQMAVFCYSRPKYPGYPSFPVRLTKPISRFTQVRTLQYLCRFVIRQNTRLDNIHKLPLPKTIKGYIEEAHY